MFGWFKKTPQKPIDIYTPKERLIYSYFNGQEIVRADPQVLYRNLMDVAPSLRADIAVSNSASKQWRTATENADKAVRQLFSIKPFAEGGLAELELFELLDHFINYCDSIKKLQSPSLTSSGSVGASTPFSGEESQPMPSSSASGCVVNDSSTGEPEPSPTVLVSP